MSMGTRKSAGRYLPAVMEETPGARATRKRAGGPGAAEHLSAAPESHRPRRTENVGKNGVPSRASRP